MQDNIYRSNLWIRPMKLKLENATFIERKENENERFSVTLIIRLSVGKRLIDWCFLWNSLLLSEVLVTATEIWCKVQLGRWRLSQTYSNKCSGVKNSQRDPPGLHTLWAITENLITIAVVSHDLLDSHDNHGKRINIFKASVT